MEADQDHDGKISFEEFTKMVENTDVSMSMTLGGSRSICYTKSAAADNPFPQINSRKVPQRYPQDELPGVLSENWLLGNVFRARLREKDKSHIAFIQRASSNYTTGLVCPAEGKIGIYFFSLQTFLKPLSRLNTIGTTNCRRF